MQWSTVGYTIALKNLIEEGGNQQQIKGFLGKIKLYHQGRSQIELEVMMYGTGIGRLFQML